MIIYTSLYTAAFDNVHRFGRFYRGKDRLIVARFLYHGDLVHVLKNAHKLQGKPYGIHEQFPKEIEDRRRLLYPIQKRCRKAGQKTKLVRDKLFIDGKLYEPQDPAITTESARGASSAQGSRQDSEFSAREKISNPGSVSLNTIKVCSWNINRQIYHKIKDPAFISIIDSYDIIFLSECWLDVHIDIDDSLIKDKYLYKCFPRTSCKGGGFILIYRKELHDFLCVENIVHESILWIKLKNGINDDNNDLYIGFVYIPHENNVFYKKNEIDLFSILSEDISMYKEKGCAIVSGDFNSRIGTLPDYIEHDVMGTEMSTFLSPVIDYKCDDPMYVRKSHDTVVNSFGRKLLQLCRSTCTRVCNGRTVGDKEGRYTFFNHIGASVNDFALVTENYFHIIDRRF